MAGAPLSSTSSSRSQRRSWTTPLRAIAWVEIVSLANEPSVHDHHVVSEAGQQHRRGRTGDASADDHDVVPVLVWGLHERSSPCQSVDRPSPCLYSQAVQ